MKGSVGPPARTLRPLFVKGTQTRWGAWTFIHHKALPYMVHTSIDMRFSPRQRTYLVTTLCSNGLYLGQANMARLSSNGPLGGAAASCCDKQDFTDFWYIYTQRFCVTFTFLFGCLSYLLSSPGHWLREPGVSVVGPISPKTDRAPILATYETHGQLKNVPDTIWPKH